VDREAAGQKSSGSGIPLPTAIKRSKGYIEKIENKPFWHRLPKFTLR